MTIPPIEGPRAWTAVQRVGFRFVVAYFGIFGVGSLLDTGQAPRALLARLHEPVVSAFARALFGVAISDRTASVRVALAQQIAAFVVAAAIAGVWSVFARRLEYRRFFGWFQIVLRYYVGVVMSIYGGAKVVDVQFPGIPIEQLSQPLGAFPRWRCCGRTWGSRSCR